MITMDAVNQMRKEVKKEVELLRFRNTYQNPAKLKTT
mgnify:FL=1